MQTIHIYLIIAGSVLAVAGLTIAILKWGLKKNAEHAWHAFRGWLIMIPLVIGAILLGRTATIIFFGIVAIAGFTEFARATGLYRDWLITGWVYLGIAGITIVTLISPPGETLIGWYGMFMALPVYVVAGILLMPILRDKTKGQLQLIALGIVGFIYIGWMFGHLAFLANGRNAAGAILFLLFSVPLCDVAAFTFGKMFGRNKMRPNISPNKTWEGSFGALLVGMALPWIFRFSLEGFGTRELILAGLIVGVGSQLGDLSISVIKRDIGIKDMGALIEGHGGVLDRIDSLVYVAPLFFHMTRYFVGLA
ncbi:MAG TPA: phosphatidate cytidylyltransferase [Thermoanaerobaculia bacterium]|jgi:phosphatidate cytidylyltransferase|nr:phosphatidate cytidylyltransferase [Thermoanaerobaculia bacterium]